MDTIKRFFIHNVESFIRDERKSQRISGSSVLSTDLLPAYSDILTNLQSSLSQEELENFGRNVDAEAFLDLSFHFKYGYTPPCVVVEDIDYRSLDPIVKDLPEIPSLAGLSTMKTVWSDTPFDGGLASFTGKGVRLSTDKYLVEVVAPGRIQLLGAHDKDLNTNKVGHKLYFDSQSGLLVDTISYRAEELRSAAFLLFSVLKPSTVNFVRGIDNDFDFVSSKYFNGSLKGDYLLVDSVEKKAYNNGVNEVIVSTGDQAVTKSTHSTVLFDGKSAGQPTGLLVTVQTDGYSGSFIYGRTKEDPNLNLYKLDQHGHSHIIHVLSSDSRYSTWNFDDVDSWLRSEALELYRDLIESNVICAFRDEGNIIHLPVLFKHTSLRDTATVNQLPIVFTAGGEVTIRELEHEVIFTLNGRTRVKGVGILYPTNDDQDFDNFTSVLSSEVKFHGYTFVDVNTHSEINPGPNDDPTNPDSGNQHNPEEDNMSDQCCQEIKNKLESVGTQIELMRQQNSTTIHPLARTSMMTLSNYYGQVSGGNTEASLYEKFVSDFTKSQTILMSPLMARSEKEDNKGKHLVLLDQDTKRVISYFLHDNAVDRQMRNEKGFFVSHKGALVLPEESGAVFNGVRGIRKKSRETMKNIFSNNRGVNLHKARLKKVSPFKFVATSGRVVTTSLDVHEIFGGRTSSGYKQTRESVRVTFTDVLPTSENFDPTQWLLVGTISVGTSGEVIFDPSNGTPIGETQRTGTPLFVRKSGNSLIVPSTITSSFLLTSILLSSFQSMGLPAFVDSSSFRHIAYNVSRRGSFGRLADAADIDDLKILAGEMSWPIALVKGLFSEGSLLANKLCKEDIAANQSGLYSIDLIDNLALSQVDAGYDIYDRMMVGKEVYDKQMVIDISQYALMGPAMIALNRSGSLNNSAICQCDLSLFDLSVIY